MAASRTDRPTSEGVGEGRNENRRTSMWGGGVAVGDGVEGREKVRP